MTIFIEQHLEKRPGFDQKLEKLEKKSQNHNKFPKDFCIFDPIAIIFAMDIYIFLESVCQGAAGEPIKTRKS